MDPWCPGFKDESRGSYSVVWTVWSRVVLGGVLTSSIHATNKMRIIQTTPGAP